jgi:hypothetical protein
MSSTQSSTASTGAMIQPGSVAQAKIIGKLIEGEKLSELVHVGTVYSYQGDERSTMVLDIPEPHGGGPKCPKCKKATKLRSGRRGLFYGCTGYPTCDGALDAEVHPRRHVPVDDRHEGRARPSFDNAPTSL